MEKKITFNSGPLLLEGVFNKLSKTHGAVITHPHPLYGGDLSNPVVESLTMSFNKKNFSTIRFNFRGVAKSKGAYDEGNGEQDDILAAIQFLVSEGITTIHLVGYSFGAWVIAQLQELPAEISNVVLVSPPVALLPFVKGLTLPSLQLVITGEEDEIAPAELIRESIHSWNPKAQLTVINFADHFYYGFFPALEKIVADYLSEQRVK